MADLPTIIFVGGGTGGHIFPNLAVLERLRHLEVRFSPHFLISHRPLDAKILAQADIPATSLVIESLGSRPWSWPRRLKNAVSDVRAAVRVMESTRACAVVATGGFVSVAAAFAARRCRLPLGVVNLDAVPGRANRLLVGRAERVFTAYPWPAVARAESIGVPLRGSALGQEDPSAARYALGLDPSRDTLLIVGGSQGARTLNEMGPPLARACGEVIDHWQWLHVAGSDPQAEMLRRSYAEVGVRASVFSFSHAMGQVWTAATVAISRAGAGSVAEAWANGVPCIFLPYPHHRDGHQKLNAQPLVNNGGAFVVEDMVDPLQNAESVAGLLTRMVDETGRLKAMRRTLQESCPSDGADVVAQWLATIVRDAH